ncbi:phosphopantetheine-binding protein [Streptomyces sp. MP131-18]|uniref:phosphopantetheine-binding protein n=1 Tax=Streptomyces sp. MP131-18 TaxID=1857892 RepID=UPI00097CAD2C|nr:phosphopantetheine-binding protein [Streptomyces sp. MP131-18]ONK14202.1 acyl carrier protein [Streptomyces sp. MP131-18]
MSQEITRESVERSITAFVSGRIKTDVPADQDLFESGLVSSLLAMELVVHVEREFSVQIPGNDLRRDSFRTIRAMTDLVLRLTGDEQPADA